MSATIGYQRFGIFFPPHASLICYGDNIIYEVLSKFHEINYEKKMNGHTESEISSITCFCIYYDSTMRLFFNRWQFFNWLSWYYYAYIFLFLCELAMSHTIRCFLLFFIPVFFVIAFMELSSLSIIPTCNFCMWFF